MEHNEKLIELTETEMEQVSGGAATVEHSAAHSMAHVVTTPSGKEISFAKAFSHAFNHT